MEYRCKYDPGTKMEEIIARNSGRAWKSSCIRNAARFWKGFTCSVPHRVSL